MEKVGTNKAKNKFTLEEWKKEAEAARKRAVYWKKQSDQWEGRFFLVQDNIQGEIEAINKKLEIAETQLRWANDANKVLKESNVELRGANDEMIQSNDQLRERLELQTKGIQALEEDASKYRLEIKLLKIDFENEKNDHEKLIDEYNVLKNIQRHTALLGWAGWIFFFVALFGFIFLKS
jgi:predicted RNase H-like nuclease (RuvC/YqgF family)